MTAKIIKPTTTIQELLEINAISVRSYNICKNDDIALFTAQDILDYVKAGNDFLKIRNCGIKTAKELMRIANDIDQQKQTLSVLTNINIDSINEQFELTENGIKSIFIDEYNSFVNDPSTESDIIEAFKTCFPQPSFLYYHFANNVEHFYNDSGSLIGLEPRLRYFFRKKIIQCFSQLSKRILPFINESNSRLKYFVAHSLVLKHESETINLNDYYKYELSEDAHSFLESELHNLIENTSVCTKKIQKAYMKSIYDLFPILNLTEEQFINRVEGKQKTCTEFYENVLLPFRQIFISVLNGATDENSDIYFKIRSKFPMLNEETVTFVQNFYNEHEFFPMFYILLYILVHSKHKYYQIFNMRYGLIDNKLMSLDAIASSFNLTKQRIEQILAKPLVKQLDIIKSDEWAQYVHLGNIFICSQSDYFHNIVESEQIDISFTAFATIYSNIFPYEYNDDFGCEYLVSTQYAECIKFVFKTLTDLKKNRYSKDTIFPYLSLFNSETYKEPFLTNLVLEQIAPTLNILVENSSFVMKQNYIDEKQEVYDLLYNRGEPIHIDDILNYLHDKYPQKKLSLAALKSKLKGSPIIPIGKTSMYKLKHWHNVYSGHIRDLIRDIMAARELPISIDELTDKITDVFDTNKKNIHASLGSCNDFIPFGKGLYGLRSKSYPQEYVEVDSSRFHAPFEERFDQYKAFVEQYQRFPYTCGEETEDSLKRWQINVMKQILNARDEQVNLLEKFIKSNSHLPFSGIEYKFYRKCQDYIDYVKCNYELPSRLTNLALCNWFDKHKTRYMDYDDNRKLYFETLLSELRSYGFIFDI